MDADIWAGGTAVRSSCVCINTRDVFPCITEPCNFAGAECKRGLSRHRTLSPPPGSSLQHTLLFSTLLSFTPVFWQQNSLSFSSSPFCLAAKSHLRCFTSMCNHGDWQIESYRITGRLCRALYYLHLKGNVFIDVCCLFICCRSAESAEPTFHLQRPTMFSETSPPVCPINRFSRDSLMLPLSSKSGNDGGDAAKTFSSFLLFYHLCRGNNWNIENWVLNVTWQPASCSRPGSIFQITRLPPW